VRRGIVLIAVVAALGFPAAATAAGPLVTICGERGCVATSRDNGLERLLAELTAQGLEGTRQAPEPVPQPYFKVTISNGSEAWYAPGGQLLKTQSGWKETDAFARAAFKTAIGSLAPLPAPKPTSVRVNGRAAPTPALYSGLLADLPETGAPPADARTATVELHYGPASPWDEADLAYAPTENSVKRADGWFSVPDTLAAKVEADLRQEGVQGRRSWGSSIVVALVLTGALFVGWLTFYRRKWWKTGGRKRRVSAPEGEAPRSSPRR
jgi:hypothetical protein